jgi:hypothetical protein
MARRVLVAQAPVRPPGERAVVHVPARVAVLFWRGPMPLMTVIVKAAASFRGEGPRRRAIFVPPRPWRLGPPRPDDDVPLPDDFAPTKTLCDVMVCGHVELLPRPSGEVPARQVTVRAGGSAHSFVVANKGPGRLPLRAPFVQTAAGTDASPGARATPDPASSDFAFDADFDWAVYQAAHPSLRPESVDAGTTIALEGLDDTAERLEIELGALAAQAVVDWTRSDERADVELFLDTVNVDLDAQVVDLCWRGFVPTTNNPRHDVDRVAIGFADDRTWDLDEADVDVRFAPILRELPRGRFSYAWEIGDVLAGEKPPALPEEELEMARHEALGFELSSDPTLTLAEHAAISAELAEEREERAVVLEKHGLDEFSWALEERALVQRLAEIPLEGEEPAQQAYARHFREAQDRFHRPEEDRVTARDYAEIRVRLEVENPKEVLQEIGLPLGAWMRVDRRWQERMAKDAAVAAEIDAHLTREREARGERRPVEVDDEGRIKS